MNSFLKNGEKVELRIDYQDGKGRTEFGIVTGHLYNRALRQHVISVVALEQDDMAPVREAQEQVAEDLGYQRKSGIPYDSSFKNFDNVLLSGRFRRDRMRDMGDDQMAENTAARITETTGPAGTSMAAIKLALKNDVRVYRMRRRIESLEEALAKESRRRDDELTNVRRDFFQINEHREKRLAMLEENIKSLFVMTENTARANNELNSQVNGMDGLMVKVGGLTDVVQTMMFQAKPKKKATSKRKR